MTAAETPHTPSELDRQIFELTHAISLNPGNAKAFRDRGIHLARKQDFDRAFADIDRSVELAPEDARGHELRGLLWQRQGQHQKAIADFDRAIALDPANKVTYAAHREKSSTAVPRSRTPGPDSTVQTSKPAGSRLIGFVKSLAQYYAEFLSTDFKRQRLPKRRLQNTDAQGRLVGIPLQKYPGFQQKVWAELAKPIGLGLSITIPRGSWRSALPKAMVEVAATQIGLVAEQNITAVVSSVLTWANALAKKKGADPEVAFEQFVEKTRAGLAKEVISPLLDRMEQFFARTEQKPIESMKDLEDQLSVRLTTGIERAAGAAFAALMVKGEDEQLSELMLDHLDPGVVRKELTEFFAGFSATDLYVELSDLMRSSRLIENADFYLHIGEVHHQRHVFPIFFMPFRAERTDSGMKIESEPRVYVNKRAMDYVAQEVAKAEGRGTQPSVIRDRIRYLEQEDSVVGLAQKLFDDMAGGLNLRAAIDFREPRDQKTTSVLANANNRISFSIFDRSDESLVNDYEAMVVGAEEGGDVVEFFKSLIDDFLVKNPVSVRGDVDRDWDGMPMTERLVFDSPLPLVEEQRKILSAIKHSSSRFIAVEGPPGTGKSHTITAVAFDLILSGKSLLILSDKKEALDVVDDKLRQALVKARPSEDFPHPILRLGKDASNYAKILRKSTIERLQVNQRLVGRKRGERERALQAERTGLTDSLTKTADAYRNIDVAEIAAFEGELAQLVRHHPDARHIYSDATLSAAARDFALLSDFIRGRPALATILRWQGRRPSRLNELSRLAAALADCPVGPDGFGTIVAFSRERLQLLDTAIAEVEEMRIAVFGYLFAGKKLRSVSRRLYEGCKIEVDRPQVDLPKLKSLRAAFRQLLDHLTARSLQEEFDAAVVLIAARLAGPAAASLAPAEVLACSLRLEEYITLPPLAPARDGFYSVLTADDGPCGLLHKIGALKIREAEIREKFAAVPKDNYVGAKAKIESLNAQALAERIDERLLDFYDNQKNDALALGKIIREKQRFPLDKFADIQRAFPCIIAGLRDYAEFIPFERELFDLVIIDEASQVSIAQALPAILRAKKVLVLGDKNQFGNVKTTNASQAVNAGFMNELRRSFSEDFAGLGQSVMTKIDHFNIRSSVLDFVEPIASFSIQLKKHFRSYPEMISFSSKYFYADSLQVMKIRGVPVSQVIEFDAIDHDGLIDQRNINKPEAARIIDRLEALLDAERPPTAGVITPHTEQQAYIAKMVADHPRSDDFEDRLRLKVMTFDSCQGEEREVVFYSMVATKEKDRLAYIFPAKIDRDQAAEVDHNLRLQRLNVGLSRGQEKIVFVHSKPLDEYASAMRTALLHYRRELDRAQEMPTEDKVDSASPMESKVLAWLGQVPLIRDMGKDCEVQAQFELGKYLRQLDPSYRHPDYRVDFLVRFSLEGKQHQIALEYDGFEFHFEKGIPPGLINQTTWRSYLTDDDLEREKILESFGVPIVRLNRFNLGENPVATIDRLLRDRLEMMLGGAEAHELVSRLADQVNVIEAGLKSGTHKRCKQCDRDLPLSMFESDTAKSGYGRYCFDCQSPGPRYQGGPSAQR